MSNQPSFKQKLTSILFWSVISAAFIGPGTITTASLAGSSFKLSLLWALIFSIGATIVLQEATARITIVSGKNLGEIIAVKFKRQKRFIGGFAFLSVAFGCAAYQAGNILGAISGLNLILFIPRSISVSIIIFLCAALLWSGSFKFISRVLGVMVAIMGLLFCIVALKADLTGYWFTILPNVSKDSMLLITGLIGTTIVPYNLFLGSGLSVGQNLKVARVGITVAVLIGGIISTAILIVGTQIPTDSFDFSSIGENLSTSLGTWASIAFGLGLFAAGLSSAITAPFAAAITAKSLFSNLNEDKWEHQSTSFRIVWVTILAIGFFFAITNIKPIPAILMAQVLNGFILPIVAIFIILVVNDKKIMGAQEVNNLFQNIVMITIMGLTCFLGLNNIGKALIQLSPATISNPLQYLIPVYGIISTMIMILIYAFIKRKID